jgi:hypothetical protein
MGGRCGIHHPHPHPSPPLEGEGDVARLNFMANQVVL